VAHDLDFVEAGGVQREGPLDPDAVGHLADRERPTVGPAAAADDDPLKDLYPFLLSLDHFDVDARGVAGPKRRHVGAELFAFDLFDRGHGVTSFTWKRWANSVS